MAQTMLSTTSNPFNPFTNFDEWLQFDIEKQINSCALLARVAKVSTELSEASYEEEVERAIDVIMSREFPLYDKDGNEIIFIKVREP